MPPGDQAPDQRLIDDLFETMTSAQDRRPRSKAWVFVAGLVPRTPLRRTIRLGMRSWSSSILS
jgi:hypothetical protein